MSSLSFFYNYYTWVCARSQ